MIVGLFKRVYVRTVFNSIVDNARADMKHILGRGSGVTGIVIEVFIL